jgi:hypothetical protein
MPLPSQKKFHDSVARFKGFSGPIGSGKSQALCQEAIRLGYLNPGRTGLLGAPTYPMLRDSTLTALLEVLNENEVPFEHHKSENVLTLKQPGARVLLRSIDEFERLRGTNLAWFGVDELTYAQEEAWLRLEGRLRDPKASRLAGFAVWTPKGFDWVYRKFIQNRGSAYDVVLAQPYENRFLLDQVPGDYLNSKGSLVYKSFARETNIEAVDLDPNRPVYWAVDFNVNPMSSVIAQAHGNDLSVVDEIVLHRASTRDACEEFERRVGMPSAGLVVFGDASGASMHTTGFSDYAVIREFFRSRAAKVSYRVPSANPPVKERVLAVNARLKNARGEAHLFVNPRCRELIADFEQVSYMEDSTQIDKDKDRRRTHASDALGYLVFQESQASRFGERTERLF